MNKLWLIIKHEYLYNLKRPAFLFAALGTPLFMVALIALSIFIQLSTTTQVSELQGVGYVDNADVLSAGVTLEDYPDLFIAFETDDDARLALDNVEIDLYFVIAEDYFQSGDIQLLSYNGAPDDIYEVLNEFIRANLVVGEALGVSSTVAIEGIDMTVYLQQSDRELTEEALPGLIVFPLIFAVIFVIATQVTSGFLMSGLVDERTNRIMELLVTSVTPGQLLAGKILGLFLLGLTQLVIWIIMILLVITFGQDIPFLSGITLPFDLVIYSLIYFVLGYLAVASFMAGLGAISDSEQESRQYAFIISFPLFVPYFFLVVFLTEPDGTVATALSIIPLTSPMSMIMRLGITSVPLWQLALSIGLLFMTSVLFIWGGIRIFHWGMLLYGKSFNLREIWAVLRGKPYISKQKEAQA